MCPLFLSHFNGTLIFATELWKWLRWSRGSVLASGTLVRGFKPGRSRRIFRAKKILGTPSFGGEVQPSVPCRALRHVKEPKSDVEVVTFGKILGHFSPIVPPSAAGFDSVASDAGGPLWRKLERSKSLVLLQVGGFDVPLATALCKVFLLRMLNDSYNVILSFLLRLDYCLIITHQRMHCYILY
jgi:hypothetical protein